jgi:hypothetical protein
MPWSDESWAKYMATRVARGLPTWTAEENKQILALRAEGLSCVKIAERMGKTKGAIIGKLGRLRGRGIGTPRLVAQSPQPGTYRQRVFALIGDRTYEQIDATVKKYDAALAALDGLETPESLVLERRKHATLRFVLDIEKFVNDRVGRKPCGFTPEDAEMILQSVYDSIERSASPDDVFTPLARALAASYAAA